MGTWKIRLVWTGVIALCLVATTNCRRSGEADRAPFESTAPWTLTLAPPINHLDVVAREGFRLFGQDLELKLEARNLTKVYGQNTIFKNINLKVKEGEAIVIIGPSGTGKSTLGMQFIYNGIRYHNEPGLIVTFEELPQQYYRDAEGFGWDFRQLEREGKLRVIMTSPDCQSGTERIASVLNQLEGDLILNVQGDEPLVDPVMLDALIDRWESVPCELITPVFKIQSLDDLRSPNVVKVARAADGYALYFSRSPIPYLRDVPFEFWLQHASFWGHIGVYGYSREVLGGYFSLPASPLESMERLEQLRFLEAGFRFQTVETDYRPNSVDVPEDLERVRSILTTEGNK